MEEILIKLKKCISGGQCGVDLVGVYIAKKYGYEVGGTMPKGFITQFGNKPEYAQLYNMVEHKSSSYVPRTYDNVKNSDGTIRIAYNFNSPGEICTLKAIHQYKKPYIDVDLNNPIPPSDIIKWLDVNQIETLNIAGNSEKTTPGIHEASGLYMNILFKLIRNMK